MAPCLEIFRAAATDLYRDEGAKSIQTVIDILNKTEGHIATYSGTEVQDPSYWWAVIVWESVEHHHALTNDKELNRVLCESLDKGVAKFDLHHHVTLAPNDPYPALDAPLTEFAVWKMHEGADKAKFVDKFLLFVKEGIENLPIQTGGWGASVEDDRQFTVVAGWESQERFKSAIATSPWLGETIAGLKKFADVDVRHVALVKHSK